jgi:hypothetical protein
MKDQKINLTSDAIRAIESLQAVGGTFKFYDDTLKRLESYILEFAEEIGMSDTEALHTLRVLRYVRQDLADIANPKNRYNGTLNEFLGLDKESGTEDPAEPEDDVPEDDPDDGQAPAGDNEPGKDTEGI